MVEPSSWLGFVASLPAFVVVTGAGGVVAWMTTVAILLAQGNHQRERAWSAFITHRHIEVDGREVVYYTPQAQERQVAELK